VIYIIIHEHFIIIKAGILFIGYGLFLNLNQIEKFPERKFKEAILR
jgi:hypothetical protein